MGKIDEESLSSESIETHLKKIRALLSGEKESANEEPAPAVANEEPESKAPANEAPEPAEPTNQEPEPGEANNQEPEEPVANEEPEK